jgi:hypothetical protein
MIVNEYNNPSSATMFLRALLKLHRLINNNTQIGKRNTHTYRLELQENKLVQKLHDKLEQNNLLITKADKGNTLRTIQ